MSQTETHKFLKKKDKWMTVREIAKALGIGKGSISANLNKLLARGEVIHKENEAYHEGRFWRAK